MVRRISAAFAPLLLLGLATSCADVPARPTVAPAGAQPEAKPPALATAGPLRFIEDDLPAATAKARAQGKLLFVDTWAPWCHTCLSMQHFVLGDPSLAPLASRVVFASIDTDRPASAVFLARHPVAAWPTFFVIDPASDKVVGLWVGSGSVREMRGFVEESLELHAGGARDPASLAFADARAAHAAGDLARAAAGYERAIAAGGPAWRNRTAALVAWMEALWGAKAYEACAKVGRAHLGEPAGSSAPADFASYLSRCADKLPAGAEQKEAREAAVARLRDFTAHPPAEASVDDRSDALDLLSDGLEALGDSASAKRAQEARLALMEHAARTARSPEEAATFDYGRANAYVALGRADEAVKMLEERARQFPEAYEPVARLADVLAKTGKLPGALAAARKAIERSYGPRQLRYRKVEGDVLEKMGDHAGALAALRAEVKGWESLPPGQASPDKLAGAKRRLAEAEAKAAAKPR